MIWIIATHAALAWEHSGNAHVGPVTFEVTTVDLEGASPGALQQAVRDAVADWTDDVCLQTLQVAVTETDDNVRATDSRNLVSSNTDFGSHAYAFTILAAEGEAFERFGRTYSALYDADMAFAAADWAGPGEVATGGCKGPALEKTAYELVGFALGMSRALDPDLDSLYALPDCSAPVLGEDDRAGLRALYGSGVAARCTTNTEIQHGLAPMTADLDDCPPTPFGDSPLLDWTWVLPRRDRGGRRRRRRVRSARNARGVGLRHAGRRAALRPVL